MKNYGTVKNKKSKKKKTRKFDVHEIKYFSPEF